MSREGKVTSRELKYCLSSVELFITQLQNHQQQINNYGGLAVGNRSNKKTISQSSSYDNQ